MSEIVKTINYAEQSERAKVSALIKHTQESLASEAFALEASKGEATEISIAYREEARAAFDEVVKLTYVQSYTLARRLAGSDSDAEDVLQESYSRAWRGLPKFKNESDFSTWMYRIVVNASNSHHKKRKRHSHSDYDDIPEKFIGVSGGEEEAAENYMLQRKLQAALQVLKPSLRSVVVLRDIYDLTHAEIAEELGISETAAKVRLHRARRKLREIVFLESPEE